MPVEFTAMAMTTNVCHVSCKLVVVLSMAGKNGDMAFKQFQHIDHDVVCSKLASN